MSISDRGAALLAVSEYRDLTDAELAEAEELSKKALAEYRTRDRLGRVAGADGGAKVTAPSSAPSAAAELLQGEAWRNFKAQHPGGHVAETAGVTIPPTKISSHWFTPATKTLGDAASGVAGLVTPDFSFPPAAVSPSRAPTVLPSIVTVTTTASDLVYFARESGYTNAAAPVPEDGSVVKPESTIQYQRDTAQVATVAHWIRASKQALADVGQLTALVNRFLVWGVQAVLEQQMLSGTGAPGLLGLLNTTGIQQVGPVSGDTAGIEAIRNGITAVEENGIGQPNAILMSVSDNAAIDLARDSTGRYYGLGPFQSGPPNLWGLPRVVSHYLPAGTAIVADFTAGVLYDREEATVSVSDSDQDTFVRNLVTLLAEARYAWAITKPSCFAVVTLA